MLRTKSPDFGKSMVIKMKKILKLLTTAAILAGCVAGIYYVLSYQRSEDFRLGLIGGGTDAETAAGINFRTPQMSFPFEEPEIVPEECSGPFYEDYEARGIVFCYFKENGNGLWLPCESFVPETDRIYILDKDGRLEEIEEQYCTRDKDRRQVGIAAVSSILIKRIPRIS